MNANHPTLAFHECIGIGAYGEVYIADSLRPDGIDKRVAVKVLKVGLADGAQAVERLRDEGRMLAILDHPCILLVHDLADILGRTGLITEYVEGADLTWFGHPDRLLPLRVTCEILAQVANALDSAWNKPSPETGNPLHLVHRDIKPQNIRITIHGRVKLLDFGIARTNEIRRDARTLIGDVVYTPGYVGPEVMAGDSQGPGGDIFALGATIYLALIGEAFFPQDMEVKEQRTVMLFRKKYAAYLDKRLDVIPGPDDLVTLLREMLSYWDTDRPSAREVQTRLMDIADVVGGQSATRWAVDAVFPDPVFCEGASLTGQTIRHESVRVVTESIIPKRREYAQAESFPLRNTGELTAPAQYSPPAEPVDPPSPEVVDAPVASPPSDRLYTLAMIAVGFTVGLGLAVVLSLLG